jgi:hypothetical protein
MSGSRGPSSAKPFGSTLCWLTVLGGAVACNSAPPPPTSGSPSNLTVTRQSTTELLLTWTPPAVAFDGYLLEGSAEGGAFSQIGTALLPPSLTEVDLTTQTPIPELLQLGFRLTCMEKAQPTGPGATVAFVEPINSPDTVNAGAGPDGINLQLGGHSQVANRLHVERTDGKLTLDFALLSTYTNYDDRDVSEDVAYSYSVTLTDGVHSSDPVLSDTVVIPLLPPRDFTARSTDSEHIALSWTNRSARATDYLLQRWPGDLASGVVTEVAHLAPTVGQYVDAVPAPGLYSYQLQLLSDGGRQANSVVALGVTAPSGPVSMEATVLSTPGQFFLLASDGGAFFATSADSSVGWTLVAPSGATYQSVPQAIFGNDGLVLDAVGNVHALLLSSVDAGPEFSLTHVWFDGQRWASQPAGTASLYSDSSPSVSLGISSSGALQLAWLTGSGLDSFMVAEQQPDGSFVVDAPNLGLGGYVQGTPQLVMGQARPHIIFSGYLLPEAVNEVFDLTPDPSETWTATPFLVSNSLVTYFAVLEDPDGGFGVACACDADGGTVGLGLVRRNASGWGPPESVGPLSLNDRIIGTSGAHRSALAIPEALYTRSSNGAWARSDLPPLAVGQFPSLVGVFDDGQIFLLFPFDNGLTAFFVEQP